jgi:hypothetical protein
MQNDQSGRILLSFGKSPTLGEAPKCLAVYKARKRGLKKPELSLIGLNTEICYHFEGSVL